MHSLFCVCVFFLKLIVTCGLCLIYERKYNDSNVMTLSVGYVEHLHKLWLMYAECDLNVTRAPSLGRS